MNTGPQKSQTRDTVIGVLMIVAAVLILANNWFLEIEALWDWIDGGTIILLLVGAWTLMRKPGA